LIGELGEGDPVAWTVLVITAVVVGIALLHDWRTNNKRQGL
jgi:hypothetical protein